jgi:eukaryotic-like serine/threonine-protein kinase
MSSITLNVVDGALKGRRFAFSERAELLVGRSEACDVRLPNDALHWDVSRRHCLIAASGPDVTIRDLGSRNGTYLNGIKIGQRAFSLQAAQDRDAGFPPHRLREGDRIQVGQTVFQVEATQDLLAVRADAPAGEPATAG